MIGVDFRHNLKTRRLISSIAAPALTSRDHTPRIHSPVNTALAALSSDPK
jgi:hypothetical protein